MAKWIVALRHPMRGEREWETLGVVERERPAEGDVPPLLRAGHVPRRDDELFGEDGIEMRFLPVDGGDAIVFRSRYELKVDEVTVAEAEVAALPDLDEPVDDEGDSRDDVVVRGDE